MTHESQHTWQVTITCSAMEHNSSYPSINLRREGSTYHYIWGAYDRGSRYKLQDNAEVHQLQFCILAGVKK